MRLSDLVARCNGADPELAINDEHGIPRPIVAVDHAVVMTGDGPIAVALLEPATELEFATEDD